MSIHDIQMSIPEKMVLNKDVVFEVYSDKSKLGTLKISKGTIEWAPSNFANGFHMLWEHFDRMMRQYGSQMLIG
jgi:hypothetical protein